MGKSDLDLAALIGSRICHDLISPIGAINNGLELLGMSGGVTDGAEMDLINESVGNASARIRFFRMAFGAAGDQQVGRADVASTLRDYTVGGRLTIAWGPLDAQPRRAVRLAFLGLQCMETAMPYGGRIEVTVDRTHWTLHGKADKLNVDPALWALLHGQSGPDVSPAHVQFAMMPTLIAEDGRRLRVEVTDTDVVLTF